MQPDQQQEYRRLRCAAIEVLEAVPECGSYVHAFSYWRLPSFQDQIRFTLYRPRRLASNLKPFLSTTTWNQKADLEKLRDPIKRLKYSGALTPTIDETSRSLDAEQASNALDDLGRISLPSIRPDLNVLGQDGCQYRFAFSQGLFSLNISQWENEPKIWQPTIERIEDLISQIQGIHS